MTPSSMRKATTLAFGLLVIAATLSVHGDSTSSARPTAEVRRAIRMLISPDPREEARGEVALKRLGAKALPQVRHWIRRVRTEVSRVERAVQELEGTPATALSSETTTANEYFYAKLLSARNLAREGKHDDALRLVDAILALDEANPYSWMLRRLGRRCRQRLAAAEFLEPQVDTMQPVWEIGVEPEVTFRLVNHQRKPISIAIEKGVLGEIDMAVSRHFLDGTLRRDRDRLRIEVSGDAERLVIGPGQTWEQRLELPLEETPPLSGMVLRIQISGRFRPSRWGADGSDALENLSLEVPLTEFWMVPPGQHFGCERPLEKLTAALLFGKVEPFFVAGWVAVWAGEDDAYLNEKLVRTLIAHVEDLDPERMALAGRLLAAATGEDFGSDGARWARWWSERLGAARDIEAVGKVPPGPR